MKNSWSWFDVFFLLLLILGFFRGRKRGMSAELLPVLQMVTVLVAGSFVYKPVGKMLYDLASKTVDLWICYLLMYLSFAVIVHLVFSAIKSAVGEKLVGSDMFGSMEYYFGMLAGIVRYACYILLFMALMNVRTVDYQAAAAHRKDQLNNYGNSFSTPTLDTLQISLFDESQTGRFTRQNLKFLLLETTAPIAVSRENINSGKQRALDDVMGTSPRR